MSPQVHMHTIDIAIPYVDLFLHKRRVLIIYQTVNLQVMIKLKIYRLPRSYITILFFESGALNSI